MGSKSATVVYWFDEASTKRDGGGIRALAWKDSLETLGFNVNFVGLLPAPTEGGSAKGRLSALKRAVLPLPFERKLPEFPATDLTVLTVPGVFRDGVRGRHQPVLLDWMDLWSDFAETAGNGRLARAGGSFQASLWRRRERTLPKAATFNTYAGYHDYLMQSGRSEAGSTWLPTPQPVRARQERQPGPARRLGFIGNMHYAPNELDLRRFLTQNAKALTDAGFEIRVAGFGSEKVQGWGFPVQVLGAVDDPASFYAEIDAAIVPVSSGSGIKAKAVEAFSFGVPVFGTHHVRNGFDPAFSPYIMDIRTLMEAGPGVEFPTAPLDLYVERLSPDAFTRHVDMIVRGIT